MLALKKKRETEAKAKAEEEAAAAVAAPPSSEPTPMAVDSSSSKKVSLLGIGGKKKKSEDGGAKNGTKKRSPGEIRIQKGEFLFVAHVFGFVIYELSYGIFEVVAMLRYCHWLLGTSNIIISCHLALSLK